MIKTYNYKDYVVFKMPERYDAPSVKQLKEEVNDYISAGKYKIIFDFLETKIINSPEIGLLISVYKTLKEKNGDFKIAGLCESISGLFRLTKLDKVFEIYESVESI